MNDPPKVSLSKREYKEHRKEANKEWSRRLNTLNSSLGNGEGIEENGTRILGTVCIIKCSFPSTCLQMENGTDSYGLLKSPLPTVFRNWMGMSFVNGQAFVSSDAPTTKP